MGARASNRSQDTSPKSFWASLGSEKAEPGNCLWAAGFRSMPRSKCLEGQAFQQTTVCALRTRKWAGRVFDPRGSSILDFLQRLRYCQGIPRG
jgi:hypothetical protein